MGAIYRKHGLFLNDENAKTLFGVSENGWKWQTPSPEVDCLSSSGTAFTVTLSTTDSRHTEKADLTLNVSSVTSQTILYDDSSNSLDIADSSGNYYFGYYKDGTNPYNVHLFIVPMTAETEQTLKVKFYDSDTGDIKTATAVYSGYGWYECLCENSDYNAAYTLVIGSPTPTEPTVTNNVSNTTETHTTSGTTVTVNLAANEGYKINNATASYTNNDGEQTTATLTLTNNGKNGTASLNDVDFTVNIVIEGTTSETATEPTFTNNVGNSTYSYSGNDHQYVIKITSNEGYLISGEIVATYISYSAGNTVSVSLANSSDRMNASGVLPDVDETAAIVISGSTAKIITVVEQLTNSTADGYSGNFVAGDTFAPTITANSGCWFADGSTNTVYWFSESGLTVSNDFVIDSTRTVGTISVILPDNVDTVYINANATPQTVVGSKYGSINVYTVTLDNLEEFSKVRFFKESMNNDGVSDFTLINLGDYVNRIKRIYVNVPSNTTDVIKCGNYNTGVNVLTPDSDTVTLNFGSVAIPGPNGDITDYQSELQLFMPFKGFVTLPVDYIGKEISLQYDVNVITGGGVAKLSCDGIAVDVWDVQPSRDIIYQTASERIQTIGNVDDNETLMYGIEPYLKMKYYTGVNTEGVNNDSKMCQISILTGFNKIYGVSLLTSEQMTIDEENEILALLKEGVYI